MFYKTIFCSNSASSFDLPVRNQMGPVRGETKYLIILYWVNFCTTSPQCWTQLTNLLLKFIFFILLLGYLHSWGISNFLQWSNFSPISYTVNRKHVFLEQHCMWFHEVRLAIDSFPKMCQIDPKNGSFRQIWVPLLRFVYTCLPYHWHYYATAAFMSVQVKISFLCAVECFLAKKEIETFAEVAVHFPRSWLMGTV